MTNKELAEIMDKHNTRITSLEKWRWLLTGGFLVLSVQNLPSLPVIKDLIAQGVAMLPIVLAYANP